MGLPKGLKLIELRLKVLWGYQLKLNRGGIMNELFVYIWLR